MNSTALRNSVQQAMNELQDQKLSQLVSLLAAGCGGPGLSTSAVVNRHFTKEGAESFAPARSAEVAWKCSISRHAGIKYNVPVVESIKHALVEVRPLVDTESKPISPDAVKKINDITTRLDSEVVTR